MGNNSTIPTTCSILDMSCGDARTFLLEPQSYSDIDLPSYFRFTSLLDAVAKVLDHRKLTDLYSSGCCPKDYEKVNHVILNNKDGRYAWRPLELIHPALYVSLVNRITEEKHWHLIKNRFSKFGAKDNIKCLSLPVKSLTERKRKAEQILHWWQEVEQKAIELALDYEFVIHTDITDCYGAIYTHSIAWALHTKPIAKEKKRCNSLIGNIIDSHLQCMRHGQTNGIPQGSVLMDFIAEMVLGYADDTLSEKLDAQKIREFQILRYRDDYRIFVNNSQDGERILKSLTEVMIDLGLKLHPGKTHQSSGVITSAVKEDKLSWISQKQRESNLQKHLLIIHNHGMSYPNAGSVARALGDFHRRIDNLLKCSQPLPLISIVVDIAYRNPRTYAISAAIVSKLMTFLDEKERLSVVERIKRKFSQMPNTGHLQIWLQRITLPFARDMQYDEPLCQLITGANTSIWNNEWISSNDLRTALDVRQVIDTDCIDKLSPVIPAQEVELFMTKYDKY